MNKKYIVEVRLGKKGEEYFDSWGSICKLRQDGINTHTVIVLGEYTEPQDAGLPWHPVSELPENLEDIIVVDKYRNISKCTFYKNSGFHEYTTHWMILNEIPRPKPEPVKYKPNSFWHVVFEARDMIVRISPDGKGFFAPGLEPIWSFEDAEFIKEVEL
jgi:hypothetical protein